LACARVEWDFLPTLGILPLIGRNFSADEDRPSAAKVVLLSFGLWRSRFGGDPDIVDKAISLDGGVARVIGVLPTTFELPTLHQFDLLVPQALPETSRMPTATGLLRVFARLKPGVSVEQATAQLQTQFGPYLESVPVGLRKDAALSVRSLRDYQMGSARTTSLLLLRSGGLVLLIACANVAILLLGLAARRRREMEVRAALGARRRRLLRQTLTESLVVGLSGGLAGCGLAHLFLSLIVSVAPSGLPRLAEAELDLRVLVFALAVSLFSVFLFGAIPALRSRASGSLTGSHSVGPRRGVFRQSLVVGQIAASLVLLTLTGLLLRSLLSLENQPLGMDVEDVFVSQIKLNHRDYIEPGRSQAFFEDLEDRLRALPGVTAVAVSDSLPPSGRMRARPYARISVLGRPAPEEGTPGVVGWRSVTPAYFLTLGIPILEGRDFEEQERNLSAEGTIIVSETLAGVMFPEGRPVGQRMRVSPEGPWLKVVGIAQDVRNAGIAAPAEPEYYVVRQHAPDYGLGQQITADDKQRASVIVRSPLDQAAIANQIRAEVARLDPTAPVVVETLEERVRQLSVRPRLATTLLLLFAGVAIILAAIGLYGVIWFLTSERSREIGVRIALGASARQVTKSVIWQAAKWTFTGTALGLGASIAAQEAAGSLFFGARPNEGLVTVVAVVLVLLVAISAAWIPARRAGRIDAMAALRLE
jgi:predicted permease